MRSFSYEGLKNYLNELDEFHEVEIIVMETPSRCYHVFLRKIQDLDKLTTKAIFNIDCPETKQ
ncbi:hypothetical protein [Loigolactobacillus coryniformis]|uniref:hypothetical protein n=1 Tax=Loigolactobacillus coryniformis TaxID=1610 RepID=UPI001C5E4FAD|nr:hypothetical protein [Loigolactobacillus coryniformis]MBW4801757.1 hypothetical protein [Loigolactobacillus coryniformis subsp. torquens]MBW4804457.1 hypothetical protein [Loigolactobacillus coryniformis subsp. torquens]